MVTRQSELERILSQLADELPEPHWVALIDDQGLVLSCVPEDPVVDENRVSAMSAAVLGLGDRVMMEVEGGKLRYANVAGSKRQYLMVVLNSERLLSIGLDPQVPTHATFKPLSRWVPELLQTLARRFS
jgi:predicted regulator of Ras-like GTPase activity (Roadblock/LC7/MglB family)